MAVRNPIDRYAKASLLIALGLAIMGLLLQHHPATRFWGGLIGALGEAALVGGLADWFAVRALFEKPLGIPFHTALIPRNRERLVKGVRNLVQHEWLTVSMLTDRIHAFDFVGSGLVWIVESTRGQLAALLRTLLRQIVTEIAPGDLTAFLAQAAGRSMDTQKIGSYLAELAHRARRERWLDPLLHEWLRRLEVWAGSQESRALIRNHLERVAGAYRGEGWFKKVTYRVAEFFGGIDLNDASGLIQAEIAWFAHAQQAEDSAVFQISQDGLEAIERKLREDPEFQAQFPDVLAAVGDVGSLTALLGPIVTSLHAELLDELNRPDSKIVAWGMDRLQQWVDYLATDAEARDRLNTWCRRLVAGLIEKHHSIIGLMVEEQLNRLSDEKLVEMIEEKTGDDLNWIRINGSIVGGLVGVAIYLTSLAVEAFMGP